MTEHKPLQDPKNFSEKDYKRFEFLLFCQDTSAEVLEDIVMTLAHLPTQRAQDLLARFKESDRAEDVAFLEPAVEEGKMWTIWPETVQEERDMMALKLYHKKNDHIVELMGQVKVYEYNINQYQIELQALEQLQKEALKKSEQEDIKYRIMAINDFLRMEKVNLEEANKDIAIEEKIAQKIKAGIKTERYKNLEPWDIAGFHFDGEE